MKIEINYQNPLIFTINQENVDQFIEIRLKIR
jgi:hypothetical protein